MNYIVCEKSKRPDLLDRVNELNNSAWPKFVDGENVMRTYWGFIKDKFPDHQLLLLIDDKVAAVINTAAFYWDKEDEEIDDGGIYWALKRISHDYYSNIRPNTLMALQVIINPIFRGKGLSYYCVKELIRFGKMKNYQRLVIPLRPSMKHKYPLIKAADYMEWRDEYDLPYDPWLRVHVKFGAKLVKKCKGICVAGTKKDWECWTGLKFLSAGDYVIPGGLNTVRFEPREKLMIYEQENVWAIHNLI